LLSKCEALSDKTETEEIRIETTGELKTTVLEVSLKAIFSIDRRAACQRKMCGADFEIDLHFSDVTICKLTANVGSESCFNCTKTLTHEDNTNLLLIYKTLSQTD
jgi:hypothetical protein